MLSLVETAKPAVSGSREVRGTLQIGALQSTASARLPDVLKVYASRYAQVAIAVETGTSAGIPEAEHTAQAARVQTSSSRTARRCARRRWRGWSTWLPVRERPRANCVLGGSVSLAQLALDGPILSIVGAVPVFRQGQGLEPVSTAPNEWTRPWPRGGRWV